MIKTVYLDNAATTRLDPRVKAKMLPFLDESFGNPSSVHSFGRKSRVAIEEAREIMAECINADPGEIYFTSGGTEADNFAIRMIANTVKEETGRTEIICSDSEHHAVLDSVNYLKKHGFHKTEIGTYNSGSINYNKLHELLNKNTNLVSIININNETGALNSLEKIIPGNKDSNIIFHSDCVQSFGKIPINVKETQIDSISCSAHKIHGPKGVGFIYLRSGTPIENMILGGSQEKNRRGGTENLMGIVGFAEAAKTAVEEMEENKAHCLELKTMLKEGLTSIDDKGIIFNDSDDSSPYILSVTLNSDFYRIDPEAMLMFLDINGIAVSNGAACSSGTLSPSHVILALGKSIDDASGTFRFSFSKFNNTEEIFYTLNILETFFNQFKK